RLASKGHIITVLTKKHPISYQSRQWGRAIGELPEYERIFGFDIVRTKYVDNHYLAPLSFMISSGIKMKSLHCDLIHAHLLDTSVFRPNIEERMRIRTELGLSKEPLLINVSRLVEKNDIITTLRGFNIALTQAPDMKLLIVGSGPEKERLLQETERLGIKNSV